MSLNKSVSEYCWKLIDFTIEQRSPYAKRPTEAEKQLLSEIALSHCHTALKLLKAGYKDQRILDDLFHSGTSLFDVLIPKDAKEEWLTLAEDSLVQANVNWHFRLLIGFLNFPEDRPEVLSRILKLDLDKDDRDLRGGMIECVFTGDIELTQLELKAFAQQVLDIEWEGSRLKKREAILKQATRLLKE